MRKMVISFLVAALVAFVGGDSWAGKGGNGNGGGGGGNGGGGGGDPVPAGTIYFPGGSVLADGAGEQTLSGAGESAPSYQAHGGQRWFLKAIFDGADNPDGRNSSRIVAVSADGATEVDLTPSFSTEWRVSVGAGWHFAWAKDDSFYSFTAVEWFGSGALDATAYVFLVDIDWSASTGEPSVAGSPVAVVEADLEGSQADLGFAESSIQQADWEPGGDRVVYWLWPSQGDPATSDLRVYTLSSDTDVLLTDGGIDPEWAPDGSLIAYTSRRAGDWGLYTVDPDASSSDDALLLDGGKYDYDTSRWSPDSEHVCYRRTSRKGSELARVELATGDETKVVAGEQPLGWRD